MDFSVEKRFQIYNALFLNMSYEGANDFAHLIPILGDIAKHKLEGGMDPIELLDGFYEEYKDIIKISKVDFMFKVIHYVERQIVLFDSIEDSISPYDLEDQENIDIEGMLARCETEDEEAQLQALLNEFSVRIVFTAHPRNRENRSSIEPAWLNKFG